MIKQILFDCGGVLVHLNFRQMMAQLSGSDELAQQLKDKCGVKHVIISYVGNVIGSHTGPDVLVITFLGRQRNMG
jgi:hypothetical protein